MLYLCSRKNRDVAQLASAPRSGRGGRKFESSHPDLSNSEQIRDNSRKHFTPPNSLEFGGVNFISIQETYETILNLTLKFRRFLSQAKSSNSSAKGSFSGLLSRWCLNLLNPL